MRTTESAQFELGATPIEEIVINAKSRDDIPALLKGLQYLYTNPELRHQVFALLEAQVNPTLRKDTGRPGMDLWRILVLAVLKQGLNCDFDRLTHIANYDTLVRKMLGHGGVIEHEYQLQTVIDNISLLTPALLAEINQRVVQSGHEVAGKKPGAALRGRCDSFCVLTDVHYPTDVNLLWDAMRCTIRTAASLAEQAGLGGWRQHQHVTQQIKVLFNHVRRAKQNQRSSAPVVAYLRQCRFYVARAEDTLQAGRCQAAPATALALEVWLEHARRQLDQVERRLLKGQIIPHRDKVWSIFEPHTRWIVKGKAGVSQELGVPVCVVEDQYRFILHHAIFWQGSDVDHAVTVIDQARERFADLHACSFDRGFHSPGNQRELAKRLDECTLPPKGRQAKPGPAWFKAARRQHPAIESAIHHLTHCGLSRVRNRGRSGFARAVALSVLAANLKRLGRLLREQARQQSRCRAA